MTNIKEQPSGGWMIVLLMAILLIAGQVDRICQ